VARFCAQKSELEVAERWYADSALEDLPGIPWNGSMMRGSIAV